MKKEIQNDGKSGVLNIRICDYFVEIKRKDKMKAIIDAVNALNGDLEFSNQGDSGYPYLVVDILNGTYWLSGMGKQTLNLVSFTVTSAQLMSSTHAQMSYQQHLGLMVSQLKNGRLE